MMVAVIFYQLGFISHAMAPHVDSPKVIEATRRALVRAAYNLDV